jgi:hypothetical protein
MKRCNGASARRQRTAQRRRRFAQSPPVTLARFALPGQTHRLHVFDHVLIGFAEQCCILGAELGVEVDQPGVGATIGQVSAVVPGPHDLVHLHRSYRRAL